MLGLSHVPVVEGSCQLLSSHLWCCTKKKHWAGAKRQCEIKLSCSVVADMGDHLDGWYFSLSRMAEIRDYRR